MTTHHPSPNWPGSTYNGFAGPSVAARTSRRSPPEPRRTPRVWMLGGVAAAVAAGVALGFAVQPKAVSAAKAEASATPMAVELAAPAPLPPMPVAGKLDVRPTAETTPPKVTAPERLRLPPAPEPEAPPGPRREPARAAPAPQDLDEERLDFDRPAYVEDDPGYYEDFEDPVG